LGQFSERPFRRLASAVRSISRGPEWAEPGPGDLASLVRHALRREQIRQGGASPSIALPRSPAWPDADLCQETGLDTLNHTTQGLSVRARVWRPGWLARPGGRCPEEDAVAEVTRRDYGEPLPGDPFLDPFPEWSCYRTTGQREGIRSLLTAPPGATLVLNLPT